jgi:hypothetical protein
MPYQHMFHYTVSDDIKELLGTPTQKAVESDKTTAKSRKQLVRVLKSNAGPKPFNVNVRNAFVGIISNASKAEIAGLAKIMDISLASVKRWEKDVYAYEYGDVKYRTVISRK